MPELHARLGPSNHRWPDCPGSVREEEKYPDIAGEAAIDGTGSHLLLELCLINGVPAMSYDGQIIGVNHDDQPNGWMVDAERARRVQMCLDYVTSRVNELKELYPGATVSVYSEARTNPGEAFGRDDWWGTVDITITVKDRMMGDLFFVEVIDYKDGRGYVQVQNNTQLLSYLFGQMAPVIKYENKDPGDWVFASERVGGCRMTIVQPKTNPVVRYTCSTNSNGMFNPATVVNSAIDLAMAANRTDDPDAPLVAGRHCQWCKANPKRGGHCTAAQVETLNMVTNMNDNFMTKPTDTGGSLHEYLQNAVSNIDTMSTEELAQIADLEPGIQSIFDKVKDKISDYINHGTNVSGYAMVPGRGSNVWNKDEDVVVKKLKAKRLKKDQIYPAKLISPAQVMKLTELTDKQKESIKNDLISFVTPDKKILKRVSDKEKMKPEEMFIDVAKDSTPDWVQSGNLNDEPSFF